MSLETNEPSTEIFPPPALRAQVPRLSGGAVCREVCGGGDGDNGGARQGPRHEPWLELGGGAQRDVIAFAQQIHAPRRSVDVHLHLRIGARKVADQSIEAWVQHRRRRHPQRPADDVVGLPDACLCLLNGVEHDPRVSIESVTCVGQGHGARGTSQQAHAEPLLEPRQAPSDRRSRDTELRGGARKRLRLHGAGERK